MSEMLLLGDEAVAMGAIDAGITAGYGYPGTPSTEIMEFLQIYAKKDKNLIANWCANEKTAFETAVGVSYAGRRSLVTMKHVGLNVAADPFINSALYNLNGGLVVAVADDPGMHSSQNEQDSRFYADFARIICFEPRNHQQAYDMTRQAFDIAERFHIPVMVRLVTRLSHSRAVVRTGKKRAQNRVEKAQDKFNWMTLPLFARKDWERLLRDQEKFRSYTESSDYNILEINPDFTEFGVITSGLGGNYYRENLKELHLKPSHLHIGAYPIPTEKVKRLADNVDRLVIIEEGYPFIEKQLGSILLQSIPIIGRENGYIPSLGELNPDNVRRAIGLGKKTKREIEVPNLPARPPQFCVGCPHRDTFDALNMAMEGFEEKVITSDIGCYALGALPPYEAIESLLCMGASIGMATGAAQGGLKNVVATIGDSTFLHSGITPLIDAVATGTNITLIILDNSTVAMTGGQDTILPPLQIQGLIQGMGVSQEHIRVIDPLKKYTEKNAQIIRSEIQYDGVSVIIASRECVQKKKQKRDEDRKDEI